MNLLYCTNIKHFSKIEIIDNSFGGGTGSGFTALLQVRGRRFEPRPVTTFHELANKTGVGSYNESRSCYSEEIFA